VSVFLTSIIWI